MPLQVQDVDFTDGHALTHVVVESFYDDALQLSLFPGMSKEKKLQGVVDTETGETVSYAAWPFGNTDVGGRLRKVSGWPEGLVVEPSGTPEGLNDELATDYSNRLTSFRAEKLPERPYLHLRMMGTLPSHRGRGAGSLHLKWGTEVADREGLVCSVDSSPMSVSLYEKFGFKAVGTVVVDLTESSGTYTFTVMIREPQGP
ncbi:hypothetical protein PT974_07521 [Cladobotryum mycophilum]|uniref:N-acetyltransferase domain-containing protein n=1 Tax=Cladobotryum mycophilum TaxID=491253 RepID=A0ABR0SQN8_9HYPO